MVQVPPQYSQLVTQSENEYNLPPGLLAAILNQESGFNAGATSSAGAEGIAQFMPGTAAGFGINPYDPNQAIPAAAQYLSQLAKKFNGNWTDAIAAYNAGPGAVQQYNGVPPYAETKSYVASILSQLGMTSEQINSWGSVSGIGNEASGSTTVPGSSIPAIGSANSSTSQPISNNPYQIKTPVGNIDYSSVVTTAQSFALNAGLVALAIALVSGGILWLAQPAAADTAKFVAKNPEVLA